MAAFSRRAVITGLGHISALGRDLDTFFQALLAGKSGIRRISTVDVSKSPVRIAGEIPDFDAKQYVAKDYRKSLKLMARTIQIAVATAQLALDDSRVDKSRLDPTRFGVEFGAGLISAEVEEMGQAAHIAANGEPGHVDMQKWGALSLPVLPPIWMLKFLPNMPACHVSILHNAQGPNNTITEHDVSSLMALGEAYRIIGRDAADFFVVGGCESKINSVSLIRLGLFKQASRRWEEPEKVSRPFDRWRDGFVAGEGGGVFILEELEHAKKRGAHIYAELVGYGAAFDRDRDGRGVARAVRAAMEDAGIGPDEVDHINAHGMSTVPEDIWEARGLQMVFGSCREPVPVFAGKSYFGNMGAGGSLVELTASILALKEGLVPPTLNYEEPDPNCPIQVLAGRTKPVTKPYVVKLNLTSVGQVAAAVIRRWDE
jgi:3-oxoacyl-[acyl-carrier-protein] synthase II